jgi:hypothetical protein
MGEMRRRLKLAGLLAIGIAPFYLNGLYNSPLAARDDRTWFWVVEVFTWIVMPSVLLLAGRRLGLLSTGALGLHARIRGRERLWAVLAIVAVIAVMLPRFDTAVVGWAQGTLPDGWSHPTFRYVDVIPPPGPDTGWYRLLALVHLCLTAAVVEEFYYRAAFDQLFPRGRLAAAAYVLASSVVFAGAHWEAGFRGVAESFAVGVFNATFFRFTQNLWPLIVGHAITDWYWFAS